MCRSSSFDLSLLTAQATLAVRTMAAVSMGCVSAHLGTVGTVVN